MNSTQNIALQELGLDGTPDHLSEAPNVDVETTVGEPTEQAPQEPENMWEPSRRYQAILLLAGFTMIFHVIGINSIYGIFQVSMRTVRRGLRFRCNNAPSTRNFIRHLLPILKMLEAKMLSSRWLAPSVPVSPGAGQSTPTLSSRVRSPSGLSCSPEFLL